MKRQLILVPTALLAGAILVGCGDTAQQPPSPPTTQLPAGSTVINIKRFSYAVPQVVSPGAKITVRNEDDVEHSVTTDKGKTFNVHVPPLDEVVFTAPQRTGSYPFYCEYHPNMKATLTVQ